MYIKLYHMVVFWRWYKYWVIIFEIFEDRVLFLTNPSSNPISSYYLHCTKFLGCLHEYLSDFNLWFNMVNYYFTSQGDTEMYTKLSFIHFFKSLPLLFWSVPVWFYYFKNCYINCPKLLGKKGSGFFFKLILVC